MGSRTLGIWFAHYRNAPKPAHNLRRFTHIQFSGQTPELLSFLKQTHGPWTERDLSKALRVSSAEAKQAIGAMQLQGYIESIARSHKWRTTEEGLTVSGAKTARFTCEAVEQALTALRDRIQAINKDKELRIHSV